MPNPQPRCLRYRSQDFEVQVINDVIIMLHQIVYVLTGSSQRSVVSTTDRQHHIAASLTQSFDFAVLSVILHTISGTPCRQTGVRIFTHHKCQREVVDVMILSQRSQIRDRIQRKVNIRCINVFRPCFLRRTYTFFVWSSQQKHATGCCQKEKLSALYSEKCSSHR